MENIDIREDMDIEKLKKENIKIEGNSKGLILYKSDFNPTYLNEIEIIDVFMVLSEKESSIIVKFKPNKDYLFDIYEMKYIHVKPMIRTKKFILVDRFFINNNLIIRLLNIYPHIFWSTTFDVYVKSKYSLRKEHLAERFLNDSFENNEIKELLYNYFLFLSDNRVNKRERDKILNCIESANYIEYISTLLNHWAYLWFVERYISIE